MNNAAFFAVGNKNYVAGADTVLSIDGLTKADVAFNDQVDNDGKPIGIMPAIILVPTALNAIGTQLYKSLEIRDNTANAKGPIGKPARRSIPRRSLALPGQRSVHGQFGQGMVPAGRAGRPAGDRDGVPERSGVTDD